MRRPSIQTTHRCLGPPATCRGFVYRTVGWRVPVACCAVWLLRTQVSAVVRCLLLPWVQSAQTLLCSLPFTPFLADTFTRAFSLPYFASRLLLLALTAPTGSQFISMQCSQEVRVCLCGPTWLRSSPSYFVYARCPLQNRCMRRSYHVSSWFVCIS